MAESGVEPLTLPEAERVIERAHWQSAKSTEDVAPHAYVVLGWAKDDLTEREFWRFVALIQVEGRLEEWTPPAEWVRRWGGKPMRGRYLYPGDGFAYWLSRGRGGTPMLNREHTSVQEATPTRRVLPEHPNNQQPTLWEEHR